MLLVLALACIDNTLENKNEAETPQETGFECPPQIPDCRDSDVPQDSDPPVVETGQDDCEVSTAEAGEVPVVEECEGLDGGGNVDDAYDLSIEWQYTAAGSTVVMPAVGNLTDDNGDGKVDENDVPDVLFTSYSGGNLVALHGDGSGVIFNKSGYRYDGGTVIADVDDDGEPEAVAFTSSGAIAALDRDGNVEWTSSTFGVQYPVMTVADLDADGMPEVIGDVGIVNGEDGSTVASISGGSYWRAPVAADLDQDGTMEVILGDSVYDHEGNLEWSVSGASGISAFQAVANIDSDSEAEVFFVIGDHMHVHEHDGTEIYDVTIPGSTTHPGPPCVADFDGDGDVEIAIPKGSQVTLFEVDGTSVWSANVNDSSGAAGCSGYDVDGDNQYELLFADQDALRIYDGATGAVLFEDYSHGSVTYFEYPTIVDVDQDGSAEILVSASSGGYSGVTVFGHAGDGWNSAGPTWPVHDFGVTNVEQDGSVPKEPDASWLKYNVFRARPVVDEPAFADLTIAFDEVCIVSCDDDGVVKISATIANQGAVDVDAGDASWAFYTNDGGSWALQDSGSVPAVASGSSNEGFVIELVASQLGDGFKLVVDDGDEVSECDEDNNEYLFNDRLCQ